MEGSGSRPPSFSEANTPLSVVPADPLLTSTSNPTRLAVLPSSVVNAWGLGVT